MKEFKQNLVYHKTIPVKLDDGNIEKIASRIDEAMNNFLDELQETHQKRTLQIIEKNIIERRLTEKGRTNPCIFITFSYKLI